MGALSVYYIECCDETLIQSRFLLRLSFFSTWLKNDLGYMLCSMFQLLGSRSINNVSISLVGLSIGTEADISYEIF